MSGADLQMLESDTALLNKVGRESGLSAAAVLLALRVTQRVIQEAQRRDPPPPSALLH